MAALTLTVKDDKLRKVDEFARQEGLSREDIVDEAIDIYLRQKSSAVGCSAWGREMAERGFTEDEVMNIINDEIHLMRAEQGNRVK
jgi:predicted transcriptional regulator